jgi:hypothetical protein
MEKSLNRTYTCKFITIGESAQLCGFFLFVLRIKCGFDKIQNERSVCICEWSEVSEYE